MDELVVPDRLPLRLSDEDAIRVGYCADLYELLRAIDEVLTKDATLCIEGASIVPVISEFLRARAAGETRDVTPGTLGPKPSFFHLPLAGTNVAELRALAERQAAPEIGDHIVVYCGDEVLLSAHDAGYGYVELSRSLAPEIIRRFREALGASLREWE